MKLRRWLAGAAGLAAVLMTPVAASAAPAGPALTFPAVNLTPGGPAKIAALNLRSDAAPQPFSVSKVVAKIDISDLAGVATVEVVRGDDDQVCSQTGSMINCSYPFLYAQEGYVALTGLTFRPVPGAAVGARGMIVLSANSAEYPHWQSVTEPVTIAEGVSLTSSPSAISANAKPGTTVKNDLSVRNAGTNTVTGVQMNFSTDPWVPVARKYSNCVYAVGVAYCDFGVDLAPGTTYKLSDPFGLVMRPDLPAPMTIATTFTWRTPADNYDYVQLVRAVGGKAGNQGTLGLVAQRAATTRGLPQTDPDPADSQTVTIHVQGKQTADLAAVGARVTGAVGSTVPVKVGVRNLGPALVIGYPHVAAAGLMVTVPPGTTVVSAPVNCFQQRAGYQCVTTAVPFNPRTTLSWEFQLRIDRAGELTGKVVASKDGKEPNTANNTAKVIINPVAGAGGQGGGPGLPITGAPAGAVAAAGVMLLVAGVLMLVLGRRRRIA
jgi:hypothetical protein